MYTSLCKMLCFVFYFSSVLYSSHMGMVIISDQIKYAENTVRNDFQNKLII